MKTKISTAAQHWRPWPHNHLSMGDSLVRDSQDSRDSGLQTSAVCTVPYLLKMYFTSLSEVRPNGRPQTSGLSLLYTLIILYLLLFDVSRQVLDLRGQRRGTLAELASLNAPKISQTSQTRAKILVSGDMRRCSLRVTWP